MAQMSEFNKSNTTFSGVDMKATFGSKTIGTLQAISYSISREKVPVYTMGSANPRCIGRGKRGIAGTLIFVTFDRDALLTELQDLYFQSDIDDIRPEWSVSSGNLNDLTLSSTSGVTPSTPLGGGIAANQSIVQQESDLFTNVREDQQAAHPWYADQIPAFDITLCAANEYGALGVRKIFGVELLNEGYGISIDDIVSEQQYTYLAREVLPLQWVKPSAEFAGRMV